MEYNDNLVAPQEFESLCGMKAMKAWEKSIKHRTHLLLTYISSGVLTDKEPAKISSMDNAKVDILFQQMESCLVSSLQEVIRSSIDSFRSAIEFQVRSLNTQVSDLTERVNKLERDKSDFTSGSTSQGLTGAQPDSNPPTLSEISSMVVSVLNEEKDKERRK